MADMDLAMKFCKETGMRVENHSEEYLEWLEGSLTAITEKDKTINELFIDGE